MSHAKKREALILTGDGINCERESAFACEKVGFKATIKHINDLISEKITLDELQSRYHFLYLPGGFSFGDELGSGRILALKLKSALAWDLNLYAKRGGLVLGVCNGFQALIRMHVFGSDVSIAHNASGRFLNRWAHLNPKKTSLWTEDLSTHALPIRHGEGRLLFSGSPESSERSVALTYVEDVNGSTDQIAGLLDASGRILGLMPHPEAYIRETQRPDWSGEHLQSSRLGDTDGLGLTYFRNAYTESLKS
jgi:phosphoribosylformylglycinamidine synthase subunit PurQ / glutaminase